MVQLVKEWGENGDIVTIKYDGNRTSPALFSSSQNNGKERTMEVSFVDSSRSFSVVRTIRQDGLIAEEKYTMLSYIESTGEQYIDLGYIVKEDDVIDMDYHITSVTSADRYLFGVWDGTNALYVDQYNNTTYVRFGSDTSTTSTAGKESRHLRLSKGSCIIGNATIAPNYVGMPEKSLVLFANKSNNDSITQKGYIRCSQFMITNGNGEVVIKLKPAKRSDGKVGMLDLVSGNFFINEGSDSDFLVGDEIDIIDGYELIDYIEFNSDKCYEACVVNQDHIIECKFQRTQTTTSQYLLGASSTSNTASATIYLSSAGGNWRWGNRYCSHKCPDTYIHYANLQNKKGQLDNTNRTMSSATFTSPNAVLVGGYSGSSGAINKSFTGLVFHFCISIGGEKIVDWYPCKRLSDGVEGFWDNVGKQFIDAI